MSYCRSFSVCALALLLSAGAILAAEPQRLTTDGKLKLDPTFLNAGEIVYSVHEKPNLVAFRRLNLKDGTSEILYPEIMVGQFSAAFSRDGRYHAFVMSSSNPQTVLVIRDRKTKKQVLVRPASSRAVARDPSVSPDSKRVAFTLSDDGGHHIAVVNIDGQGLKRLTAAGGIQDSPEWSPDGKQIIFSSSRDGDFELYVMNPDGSNVQRLTTSAGLDLRPAWSPDGKRIAFTSNRDGNYEIYLMNAGGGELRRLTNHPDRDDFAVWHPDGKRLAIVSWRRGKSDIYLIEAPE